MVIMWTYAGVAWRLCAKDRRCMGSLKPFGLSGVINTEGTGAESDQR